MTIPISHLILFTFNRNEEGCIWIHSRKQAFPVGATDTVKYSNTDLDMVFHSLLLEGQVTRACWRGKVLERKKLLQVKSEQNV